MPRVAFHRARRRVVARNRQYIRLFPEQDWQCGIEILDGLFLRVKIAVLAIHVGILVVDEKKVVLVVFGEITLELFGDGLWPFEFRHADELGQTFIHRINREQFERYLAEYDQYDFFFIHYKYT